MIHFSSVPTWVKQWFLGTVVVGLVSVTFGLWTNYGSRLWQEWDQSLLLVEEISYRLRSCAESHVSALSAENLCGEDLLSNLNNSTIVDRSIVPQFRDRSFNSLTFELSRNLNCEGRLPENSHLASICKSLDIALFEFSFMVRDGARGIDLLETADVFSDAGVKIRRNEPSWWWFSSQVSSN